VPQRRPCSDPVEQAIADEATENKTDGYRMVTAFLRRKLGQAFRRDAELHHLRDSLEANKYRAQCAFPDRHSR